MVLPNGHQEFYLSGKMIKIIEGLNETDCSNLNCDQKVYSEVIKKHGEPYKCGVCGTEFKKDMRIKS
jgi:predicted HNH restriction endonuclease